MVQATSESVHREFGSVLIPKGGGGITRVVSNTTHPNCAAICCLIVISDPT